MLGIAAGAVKAIGGALGGGSAAGPGEQPYTLSGSGYQVQIGQPAGPWGGGGRVPAWLIPGVAAAGFLLFMTGRKRW